MPTQEYMGLLSSLTKAMTYRKMEGLLNVAGELAKRNDVTGNYMFTKFCRGVTAEAERTGLPFGSDEERYTVFKAIGNNDAKAVQMGLDDFADIFTNMTATNPATYDQAYTQIYGTD